jgi:hypothetical protein
VKLLSVLFAIYSLMLSIAPCADAACAGDSEHIVSEQHEDEKENDLCTSFCICSCCGMTAADVGIAPTPTYRSMFTHHAAGSLYISPFVQDFSLDFWQPPKLS